MSNDFKAKYFEKAGAYSNIAKSDYDMGYIAAHELLFPYINEMRGALILARNSAISICAPRVYLKCNDAINNIDKFVGGWK